jgi:aldose sugar dehydrogenase
MRLMKLAKMMSGLLVLGVSGLAAPAEQKNAPAKSAPTAAQAKALKNFQQICQPCHGPQGDSPMPTMSLTDGEWTHGSSTKEIAKTIAEGVPGTAMLPNKGKLTQEEILELAKLVRSFDPALKPEKGPGK